MQEKIQEKYNIQEKIEKNVKVSNGILKDILFDRIFQHSKEIWKVYCFRGNKMRHLF